MEQDALWNFVQTEAVEAFGGAGPRLGWLAQQLIPGARVLNIGVGNGAFELFAMRRGLVVHSLDPSSTAIGRLNSKYGGVVDARAGRAEAIPWGDASFDAVVMSEVLEHLEDDVLTATLVEIRRVLIDGGIFLGTVPANEDLRLNAVVCPCCNETFHRWGHVRSFSEASLRATLATTLRVARIDNRFFTPWDDLAPRRLLHALFAPTQSAVPQPSFNAWTRANWRALLSSVPRLAAHRMGVRFATNLAFVATKD